MAKEISFKIVYVVYAPPEKVFEALTLPGLIEKWGGGDSVIQPFEDGEFKMFDGWVTGRIIQFKPVQRLSFSWKPNEWNPKTKASIVEFIFKEHPAGTEILLSHTGFPDQEIANKHKEGWIDFVLDPLNDFFIK